MTAREVARLLDVHPASVRRWPARGCPVVRAGGRGPGNAGQFDLAKVIEWRGRRNGSVGLTPDEVAQRIATILLATLKTDHVDVRAGISPADAAAALLVVWEACCKDFGIAFRFHELPRPIHALMREL